MMTPACKFKPLMRRVRVITPYANHAPGRRGVCLRSGLTDNNTTDQYPLGIFHPHQKLWHIKKENIGLIEVMGRAILPARLKDELHEVKQFWLNAPNQIAAAHLPWAKEVAARRAITAENVDQSCTKKLRKSLAMS